jgi:predicted CoA-binding protein
MRQLMDIVIAALEADGASDLWVKSQIEALEGVARKRPDLVERYNKAVALRDGPEVERIWFQCQIANREIIHSVRINSVTGRIHFGNGGRSVPLFPPIN